MRRKIVRKERLFYRLKKNEAAYIFINFRTRLYLCGNGQTKGGRCGREPEKAPAGRKISSCPELPFYSAFRTTGGKLNEFVVQRTEKLHRRCRCFRRIQFRRGRIRPATVPKKTAGT